MMHVHVHAHELCMRMIDGLRMRMMDVEYHDHIHALPTCQVHEYDTRSGGGLRVPRPYACMPTCQVHEYDTRSGGGLRVCKGQRRDHLQDVYGHGRQGR